MSHLAVADELAVYEKIEAGVNALEIKHYVLALDILSGKGEGARI
jgi:hypothetical protein